MQDVIADKNYFYDAEGNVTTDEAKGTRWLAREGANVLPENREALEAFQGTEPGKAGKVAQPVEEGEVDAKPKASANKKVSPSKNKGVK